MIVHVLRLGLWEWFKLRRRWMPWVLLGIAVLFAQIPLWASYSAYHNRSVQEALSGGTSSFGFSNEVDGKMVDIRVTCADLVEGDLPEEIGLLPESERQALMEDLRAFEADSCANMNTREGFREWFVLPSSISNGLGSLLGLVPVLVMILAASVVGSEYGWGTLRTVLTRGAGRWQLLSSKILMLLVAGAAGLVLLSAVYVVTSLVAYVVPPEEAGGLADSGQWSTVVVTFVKAVYGLAPYVLLGAFLAVLTQSSAMGISISLGYYVVELILAPLLGLVDWLKRVSEFLIGQNVNYWMMEEAAVTVEVSAGDVAADPPPDALHAFLVLLAYIVVLSAVTFWLFLRRDIAGAKGA